ncbi:MAG: ATP-dependent DNA helicase RecG [Clostridia bacterium]|nr:ATP-dependent DNA helicase RecG [Clostridia bacterium]MBQ7339173.1 ATP-dependent DNA helicase RecG [Clostridia bacterium]
MIETSVGALYGVGPARVRAFAKLGVHTVEELLHHYPRAYEFRGDVKLLRDCGPEGKSAVILTVATAPRVHMIKRGMSLLKFRATEEGTGDVCEITYFNQNYLKDSFSPGCSYRFFGKIEKKGKGYAMSSPAFEEVIEGHEDELPPLLPVYPATEGLSQKQISAAVQLSLRMALTDADAMEDPLPAALRHERGLCAYSYALRNIHRPTDLEALAAAKKRLVYDELTLFALGLAATRSRTKAANAPACAQADLAPLEALLPYRLTGAQRRAIEEIRAEMSGNVPMSRMLVGDVGCGKTVCAAAAMLFAVQSGYQAALMAPTEILARQHYAELSELFGKLHISCALLIGATTAAKKRDVRAALADGSLDVVIGTQALLTEGVAFANPALMVTDEQHRFGVGQRAALSEKNRYAHLLVMSATPIPRSLALGLYGDLDISRIDEMPPGRQVVDTFVVDENYRARLNAFIEKQVAAGGQVYVVCPAIEERETIDADGMDADLYLDDISLRDEVAQTIHSEQPAIKSALAHAQYLSETLHGVRVECLHGKMKAAEKDAIMQSFVCGETQVLVSTTVIEVGVNVPNATLMIVENAERFGLSQLHQLRGRVGRGSRKSYCVLVGGERVGEVARQRLEVMRTQHDGFEIAQRDLLLRGPGDFLRGGAGDGIRQSGGIRFRLADTCDDAELLELAMQDARALIEHDPDLASAPALRRRMERMFTPAEGTLN